MYEYKYLCIYIHVYTEMGDTKMETGEKKFPNQAVRVCLRMFIYIIL
jgi:hypothetical protein